MPGIQQAPRPDPPYTGHVPDPTERTLEQSRHEITHLKALLETRLAAMDKAQDLFASNLSRVPSQLDLQVNRIMELTKQQFTETILRIDAARHTAEIQATTNEAAITKAEASIGRQLDGIAAMATSRTEALREQVGALTARVERLETASSTHRGHQASTIAIIGLVVACIVGSMALINFVRLVPSSLSSLSSPSAILAPPR